MSLLTERSRLILRIMAKDLRQWWRSRRWVRRRIIRKNCRRFIPFDGAHDEVLTLSNVPGAIIHRNQPRAFDVLEVPSAVSSALAAKIAQQQLQQRVEYEARLALERYQKAAGPETEFERRYLTTMNRPPS